MKNLSLISTFIIIWQTSFSQTVPLDSIQFYVGKTITVCSKVQSTFVTKGEKKTTYINFGKPYPNNTFTAVIFSSDSGNFKYIPSEFLKEKNVCITGKVELYKDKPQIIVKKAEQIKIE
jgi:RecG-like helicase